MRRWYVLYSRPKTEKALTSRLADRGFEAYCPVHRTKNRWSDRWKWVEKPLFSSYCFVRLEEKERDDVFTVPGFVRFLFWNGAPAVVRDQEIERLKTWLHKYPHENIDLITFAPGEKVRVGSGPLMEREGFVEQQDGNYLYLKLESLGTTVRLDTRLNLVEKL
jgi:transcription antitermination factor NusG